MSFADNLRIALEEAGISQRELAQRINVSRPAVTQWLHGMSSPTGARLEEIAKALDTTVPALFGGSQPQLQEGGVPVVGYVGAGEQVFLFEVDGDNSLEYVPMPPGTDEALVAVLVRGDSMIPAFWEGDRLYYSREAGFDRISCLYRECVVKVMDGPIYIKHVMPGTTPTTFTLQSYNAGPIRDVSIEWAAPVQFHDMRQRRAKQELRAVAQRGKRRKQT